MALFITISHLFCRFSRKKGGASNRAIAPCLLFQQSYTEGALESCAQEKEFLKTRREAEYLSR
jgi:hypothetical protein